MPPPVVDGDRVPDHLWEYGTGAAPGTDNALLATLVHCLDPVQ
jgi:hypothetical protein